ncbi:hypothetical protein ACYX33_21190 [Escherichia coli]
MNLIIILVWHSMKHSKGYVLEAQDDETIALRVAADGRRAR